MGCFPKAHPPQPEGLRFPKVSRDRGWRVHGGATAAPAAPASPPPHGASHRDTGTRHWNPQSLLPPRGDRGEPLLEAARAQELRVNKQIIILLFLSITESPAACLGFGAAVAAPSRAGTQDGSA
ncbi:microtubule-associated protein 1 light chain 3 beta [Columba livia]|uniref:Microtubule-associated protein 1 light chain 3 beta n=1 Tax=Columba livia TaxID=8932 RepID=A0A2I0LQK4_COLLI|nr:microtubule-associated protein 1 light chain 3 beta [Columba livia]